MPPESEQERLLKEEQDIMRQVTQKQALKTYKELAKVRRGLGVWGLGA